MNYKAQSERTDENERLLVPPLKTLFAQAEAQIEHDAIGKIAPRMKRKAKQAQPPEQGEPAKPSCEHSALPWWIKQTPQSDKYPDLHNNLIMAKYGTSNQQCVVATVDNADEDAQYLVRCVNHADKLAAALRELRHECQLSRKYIVLDDDNGFAAYNATSTACVNAEAALAEWERGQQ